MKEQQKRKIQQFHPKIEDGIDLRGWPGNQAKTLNSNNPSLQFLQDCIEDFCSSLSSVLAVVISRTHSRI